MNCPYVVKVADDSGRWSVYGCYFSGLAVAQLVFLLQSAGRRTFVERRGDAPPLSTFNREL